MRTEDIWSEFRDKLLGFIKTRVNNDEIAEDILQDVFIKIHLKSKSLKEKEKLTSWLYQITRNTIIDLYRKKKIPVSQSNLDIKLRENEFDLNQGFVRCLEPFINRLSENYKEALLQTAYGPLTQKAYAEKAGISYSGAKSRVQRAKLKLKSLFVKCCAVQSDKYGNIISANIKDCNC